MIANITFNFSFMSFHCDLRSFGLRFVPSQLSKILRSSACEKISMWSMETPESNKLMGVLTQHPVKSIKSLN